MIPRYVTVTTYSFLLLILGFSPFIIAAENTVPGDVLYPIKATVNEPIKKAVKVVTKPKASLPMDTESDRDSESATSTRREDDRNEKDNDKNRDNNRNGDKNDVRAKTIDTIPPPVKAKVSATTTATGTLPVAVPVLIPKESTSTPEDDSVVVPVKIIDTPQVVDTPVEKVEEIKDEVIDNVIPKINLSL